MTGHRAGFWRPRSRRLGEEWGVGGSVGRWRVDGRVVGRRRVGGGDGRVWGWQCEGQGRQAGRGAGKETVPTPAVL